MLLRTPKIVWGAAFANTLEMELFDNAIAYSEDREGSESGEGASGVEDASILGTDQFLEGDIRYIPTDNTSVPLATGWDGAAGVRAYLEWARQKNPFRWHPDRTSGTYQICYLKAPLAGPPGQEEGDGSRRLRVRMRTTDDSPFQGY